MSASLVNTEFLSLIPQTLAFINGMVGNCFNKISISAVAETQNQFCKMVLYTDLKSYW